MYYNQSAASVQTFIYFCVNRLFTFTRQKDNSTFSLIGTFYGVVSQFGWLGLITVDEIIIKKQFLDLDKLIGCVN